VHRDVRDAVPLAPLLKLLDNLRNRPNEAVSGLEDLLTAVQVKC
jgi:hypothetical protein